MAGSRIKGITVEIGGNTTKLQSALKGVNAEIKNTQSQLKDVEKLLKLDPGNTELLAQKQKLLSSAVSETKEKLATLKTSAEQANQALANGDISKEQYDALQREIIETEQDLKKLETQANQSATAMQKIATAGEGLKSAGDKVSSAGEKLLPASAAVTALGVAAVKTDSDFDSSMSQVASVSGATGEDFDKLRAKAREMGAKTKFSASEAADAMNYMAMAGWKISDMLDVIEGIMNLAAASGEDLATTSDIVTDALTAFGLTAKDSGHFADILAAASSNANTNVFRTLAEYQEPFWYRIYADDGISGTNTKKREDFNRMIDDCEAGNIDMIITKSISRFARNTLDCLKYIRQLKDKNIPVFFEKEAINTMDAKGEVLITIMASLAQQESQSLSQNVKLGLQFRYQNGQVQVNHNHFLGYKLLFILIHFSDFHIHHSVKQEMYSIIFLEQIDMLAQSNQIVLRPNRTDC